MLKHSFLRQAGQQVAASLYPYTCYLCHQPSDRELDLCTACQQDLPRITHPCSRCGEALADTGNSTTTCGRCLRKPPLYARVDAAFAFQQPVMQLVTAYKFKRQMVAGKLLGQLLAQHLLEAYNQSGSSAEHSHLPAWPQAILPVPLHRWRYVRRGFNQSLQLGKDVQSQLLVAGVSIRLLHGNLIRTRNTAPQPGLEVSARRQNLKGAFRLRRPANLPAHVALIDDVMTSGSTASECTRTLLAAGCERVDIWVVARALKE